MYNRSISSSAEKTIVNRVFEEGEGSSDGRNGVAAGNIQ